MAIRVWRWQILTRVGEMEWHSTLLFIATGGLMRMQFWVGQMKSMTMALIWKHFDGCIGLHVKLCFKLTIHIGIIKSTLYVVILKPLESEESNPVSLCKIPMLYCNCVLTRQSHSHWHWLNLMCYFILYSIYLPLGNDVRVFSTDRGNIYAQVVLSRA